MRLIVAVLLLAAGASPGAQRAGVFDQSMNHPAIKYSTADSNTVIDELNRKIAAGSAKLLFYDKTGYLKSILALLKIPVASQVAAYTQTSQQARHITMTNPRAVYFNDEASVGYIRGAGLLEIVAQDANLGSIFYVVHQEPGAAPRFGREQQCLRCHLSW